jgi:hypothetical protein
MAMSMASGVQQPIPMPEISSGSLGASDRIYGESVSGQMGSVAQGIQPQVAAYEKMAADQQPSVGMPLTPARDAPMPAGGSAPRVDNPATFAADLLGRYRGATGAERRALGDQIRFLGQRHGITHHDLGTIVDMLASKQRDGLL